MKRVYVSDLLFLRRMWSRIPWLKPVHIAILNLLSPPKRLALTPSNIAKNIEYSDGYVADQCRFLVDRGLLKVERNGDPFYSTTELGEQLAVGEIEPEELMEPETGNSD